MASTRKKPNLTAFDRWSLERFLFDELTKVKTAPSNQKDFTKFVKNQFGASRYPAAVIKSVWLKLQNCEKGIAGKVETIELSSSSSGDESGKYPLTHLIDFDVPQSDNGPQYRIIQESTEPATTCEPKPKIKATRGKSSQKKSPESQIFKKISPKRRVCEDRALMKKFRQKIILDELLRRDRQMLEVKGRFSNVEEAVVIEAEYAKRIQKDRVDSLAMEMLKQHYEQEGLGEPYFQLPDTTEVLCLLDPIDYIPSETVIAEKLPNIEIFSEPSCPDLQEVDFSQFDMLYDPSDFTMFSDPFNSEMSSSLPVNSTKKARKVKRIMPKPSDKDVAELRNELFIDKIIELQLPEIVKTKNKRKRKTI